MKYNRLSRRMFLSGAGGAALALPLLPSLMPSARAADAVPIKRFIVLHSPYGSYRGHWFPSESVRTGMTDLVPGVRHMPLSQINGPLSGSLGNYFDDVRDKMTLLDGIDFSWQVGHQRSMPLTGYICDLDSGCNYNSLPGPSIDQIIADQAAIYDGTPQRRSLTIASGAPSANLSVHGQSLSYRADGGSVTAVEHMYSAAAVHGVVFADVTDETSPEALAAFEHRKAQRLSVIDRVHSDYTRLKANPRLSQRDADRLESYLQYLREWEQSVEAAELQQCSIPELPSEDSYPNNNDMSQELRLRDHVAGIVGAIRCGVTNVITFDAERRTYTYGEIGVGDHHQMWHSTEERNDEQSLAEMALVDNLHMDVFAEIIKQLDVVEDPDTGRTFLDNSIVLVTSDQGTWDNHKGKDAPVLLFGGTDVLHQGSLIDYRADSVNQEELWGSEVQGLTPHHGRSYLSLLVSLCQAFGLSPEEYEQGQTGIGAYEQWGTQYHSKGFPGGAAAYEDFAFGDRRTPLPGLLIDG